MLPPPPFFPLPTLSASLVASHSAALRASTPISTKSRQVPRSIPIAKTPAQPSPPPSLFPHNAFSPSSFVSHAFLAPSHSSVVVDPSKTRSIPFIHPLSASTHRLTQAPALQLPRLSHRLAVVHRPNVCCLPTCHSTRCRLARASFCDRALATRPFSLHSNTPPYPSVALYSSMSRPHPHHPVAWLSPGFILSVRPC